MLNPLSKKRKRSIGDIDDPTKDELYYNVMKLREPVRSLAAFLYLTGNRVSEVIGKPILPVNADRDQEAWEYRPLRKYDVEVTPDWTMMRVKARTLKRKGRPMHTYVCRVDMPEEKRYFRIVYYYLAGKDDNEYLWNFSRYKAWKEINHATGLPPHKLRGLRATRDAVVFELDAIELKSKYNWANPNMAFHYASMSSHNIEEKLKRKQQ